MILTTGQLRGALTTVLSLMERQGRFTYRLIGTAADLLRGVPVPAADVDFLVRDRADVDTFARALADHRCLTAPNWMACCGQYYAAFEVDGVQIDASTVESPTESAFIESLGSAPWTHYSEIAVSDRRIPMVAPELRLATELCRGRKDRADIIAHWLRDNGCDVPLLGNALEARNIEPATRASVMAAITG